MNIFPRGHSLIQNMYLLFSLLCSVTCYALRMHEDIGHERGLELQKGDALQQIWGVDDLYLAHVASTCSTSLLRKMDVRIL